jgi:predicted dienelactone hydrolase
MALSSLRKTLVVLAAVCFAHTAWAETRTSKFVLQDLSRHRDIPLKVYYPSSTSPDFAKASLDKSGAVSPVLLFSHGLGGSRDGYVYFGEGMAERGYVVILPTHEGSDKSLVGRSKLVSLIRLKRALKNKDEQAERPADISFLISHLADVEKKVPGLKLDAARIGVAGHSYGASTVMLLAGAVREGDKPGAFFDSRIKAFVALSPQGIGGDLKFGVHAWDGIQGPVLCMSGSEDRGAENQKPEWRMDAFTHMTGTDKFHLLFEGADHLDFSDSQLGGKPSNGAVHRAMLENVAAFFDFYLNGKQMGWRDFPKTDDVKVIIHTK